MLQKVPNDALLILDLFENNAPFSLASLLICGRSIEE